MEEIGETIYQNFDTVYRVSFGFLWGAINSYQTNIYSEKSDRETFELNEEVLEQDPHYNEEMYNKNKLEDLFYQDEDRISEGAGDLLTTGIAAIGYDLFHEAIQWSEAIELHEYPEFGAGFYAGMKLADQIPTPQQISEFRDRKPEGIPQEKLYEKE